MASPAVAAGSLQLGKLVRKTCDVVGRNWLTLAGVSLLFVVAPGMLIGRAYVWLGIPQVGFGALLGIGFGMAAILAPYGLLVASTALIAVRDTEGRRADLAETLGGAFAALPRVLTSNILLTLGVLCGMVLLIVPGIIAALAWSVALPAATVERRWGWGALKRSNQLTGQRRAEIFGINFAVGIVFGLIGICSTLMVRALGFPTDAHGWPMLVAEQALQCVAAPFTAMLTAVIYLELRRIHEGLVPGEASVFD